mmetsp:Transcript_46328/g.34033  ORF Transcript_46328/g.34033 Transcript_46328/m.34033 type:complete len:116 (+) Transcript_46328:514-861(+)
MLYVTKDQREVILFNFATKEKQLVLTFNARDGLVSHMKMLFVPGGKQYLFYVRNAKDIIRYEIDTKVATLVGTAHDAILAIYVTTNAMREVDLDDEEKKKGDPEHIRYQEIEEEK